jgi:hypothetical protein
MSSWYAINGIVGATELSMPLSVLQLAFVDKESLLPPNNGHRRKPQAVGI